MQKARNHFARKNAAITHGKIHAHGSLENLVKTSNLMQRAAHSSLDQTRIN